MSLEAVDYVFSHLAAAYGAAWDRSLGTAPIADVKSFWADRLSDFTHSENAKRSILWALKNLPERVPNAIEFHKLCRAAPAPEVLQLPEPKADPERVKAELAKLGTLRTAPSVRTDGRAWAHAILADVAAGARRSPTVVAMARLGAGLEA